MPITRTVAALLLLFVSSFASSFVWADVTEIDNKALQELMAAGVPVVDLRRIDEWQETGVIDGAHLLTFFDKQGRYDAEKWIAALGKITSQDEPVILICASGVRSKTIAKLMNKHLGYSSVHNHTLGMFDWIDKGKPVVAFTDQ